MRMFIASTLSDTIDLFISKVGYKPLSVLFIANPADPFKNKYWVNKDRKAFTSNGFKVTDLDLRTVDAKQFKKELLKHRIIHICGGSAIYILKLLRDKKMDSVIIDAVKNYGVIYTGTSAGSMIAGPDISFCADDEDEKEAMMIGKVKNLKSLALHPFYIMCHAQEKYYIPSTKKSIDRLPKNKLPILFLNDNMALWIDNCNIQFLKN